MYGIVFASIPRDTAIIVAALSTCAANDANAKLALEQLPKLAGSQLHSTVILSSVDITTFKKLGIEVTNEAVYENKVVE